MTEFGTITDPDEPHETLVCVCKEGGGNGHQDGFYPADENGFVLGDTKNTKEHLIPWPDTRFVHALCPECGRLYSDEEIALTGKARVVKQIDFTEPGHQENIHAHLSQF